MDSGNGIKVDGSGYDFSEIVVGMVSAKLSSARCREDCQGFLSEELLMLLC